MWFARLFGGRDDEGSDDELPTATAPQPPALTRPPAVPTQSAVQNGALKKPPKGKGFDPYNSGTFERQNAWERITRR